MGSKCSFCYDLGANSFLENWVRRNVVLHVVYRTSLAFWATSQTKHASKMAYNFNTDDTHHHMVNKRWLFFELVLKLQIWETHILVYMECVVIESILFHLGVVTHLVFQNRRNLIFPLVASLKSAQLCYGSRSSQNVLNWRVCLFRIFTMELDFTCQLSILSLILILFCYR